MDHSSVSWEPHQPLFSAVSEMKIMFGHMHKLVNVSVPFVARHHSLLRNRTSTRHYTHTHERRSSSKLWIFIVNNGALNVSYQKGNELLFIGHIWSELSSFWLQAEWKQAHSNGIYQKCEQFLFQLNGSWIGRKRNEKHLYFLFACHNSHTLCNNEHDMCCKLVGLFHFRSVFFSKLANIDFGPRTIKSYSCIIYLYCMCMRLVRTPRIHSHSQDCSKIKILQEIVRNHFFSPANQNVTCMHVWV